MYEARKYISVTSHLWDGWYTLINPKAFGKLPKDMQDPVMAEFDRAGLDVRKDLLALPGGKFTLLGVSIVAFVVLEGIPLIVLFAPPYGVGFYAAAAIERVGPNPGMQPIVGYLLALLIRLIVVAAIPWISIGFL